MKIKIFDGCRDYWIKIDDIEFSHFSPEVKKNMIKLILNRIDNEEGLDIIFKDVIYYLDEKYNVKYESDQCGQCGDYNTLTEYEINNE